MVLCLILVVILYFKASLLTLMLSIYIFIPEYCGDDSVREHWV